MGVLARLMYTATLGHRTQRQRHRQGGDMPAPSQPTYEFGIHTIQTWTWPELRDRWRWFEALGFDSLWLPDHFFPTMGRDYPMFEAWTLLSGLAMVTSRARIGILVSSNTFRHPALLAK